MKSSNLKSKSQSCDVDPKSGFSLIITVSVMVLLMLLAVGLLSLSSITLRQSNQNAAMTEAKANARLALNLAIGQLQQELGPDQRVNGPSDLIASSAAGSQGSWTGVWDSWGIEEEERPEPQFRRWLVSGNPEQNGDSGFSATSGSLVDLATGLSEVPIKAPLERIVPSDGRGTEGGFAYWVSDENAKARLGPPVKMDVDNMAEHLERFQSPGAVDHRVFTGFAGQERDNEDLERLHSAKTAELISEAELDSQIASSFSVWSEGLLTNVRAGGFKKDLSFFLSRPESGNTDLALYEAPSGRGGINFQELRNFHGVWSKLVKRNRFLHADGFPLNSDIPSMIGAANRDRATTDPYFTYQRPLILNASWHISVMTEAVRQAGSRGKFSLFVVLEPIVTLWNPFDVNLVMRPGGHMTVRCWGLPYDFLIDSGRGERRIFFNDIVSGGNTSMEIGKTEPVVMRPGEILIFSRGQDSTRATNFERRFEGENGWTGTGGFKVDTRVVLDSNQGFSIGMEASRQRGASQFGLIEFLEYVGTDSDNNATKNWNGGIMIDRSGLQGEVTASSFPDGTFQDVPKAHFGSPGEVLGGRLQPIGIFSYRARTEFEQIGNQSAATVGRYMARLNPAAGGYDHQAVDPDTMLSLPYVPVMQPLSGGLDRSFDIFNGKGFFGHSYRADTGTSYIVNRSIPREPPLTLASFQHSTANGVEKWIYPSSEAFHDRILNPPVSHIIGNSFALPCIKPDSSTGRFNGMEAVDHSYLANKALWDDWFVSSVARRTADHVVGERSGTAREIFERFIDDGAEQQFLPNKNYRYAGERTEKELDLLFQGANPTPEAHLRLAELMKVHGAFNVNSTSKEAWKALLGSTAGSRVPVESAVDGQMEWVDSGVPLAGLLVPAGGKVEAGSLSDPSAPEQWTGYRDLNEEELDQLAETLVKEIRLRGPFLSLADFINRRLGRDENLAAKGALQAALDQSVNRSLESGTRAGTLSQVSFAKADAGARMTHVPGHVKQADVLTSIGSRLTPRSDTFTIRAYGDARTSSGQVIARALCEAVVSRSAGWLDPADEIDTPVTQLTKKVNQNLGRRFQVRAFRWLKFES